jgi:hypothetical protein
MELDELKLGLNNMRGQGNFEKVCTHHEHEVCAPWKILYKGTTSLWESIVCPKRALMSVIIKNVYMEIAHLVVWESCLSIQRS